jgi:molybdate transport system substrate-binding protein
MPSRVIAIALLGAILHAAPCPAGEIFVAAAASLREPVQKMARDFEAQNEGVRVRVSFGASSHLARQIQLGAPLDVFISADERWVLGLVARGLVEPSDHFRFAGNRLVVVAASDREIEVQSAGDLLDSSLESLALPGAAVPLGRYARQWLESTGLLEALAPRLVVTEHARASLVAVDQRHAAAAIVYATDARQARASEIVYIIPESQQPSIVYSAALTKRAQASSPAAEFYRFLKGPEAGSVLAEAGFLAPKGMPREPAE